MQYFTLHLPCKTYIKKYLQTNYGQIVLPAQNTFSDVTTAILTSSLGTKLGKRGLDEQLQRYNDVLPIKCRMDLFYRSFPKEIPHHATIRINRFFENQFKEHFCNTVDLWVRIMNIERKQAIEKCADANGLDIEIDITFEALKKMEHRHRIEKLNTTPPPPTTKTSTSIYMAEMSCHKKQPSLFIWK